MTPTTEPVSETERDARDKEKIKEAPNERRFIGLKKSASLSSILNYKALLT
jgi:hypothetical protein